MSMLLRRRGAASRRKGGGTGEAFALDVWDAAKPPTSTSWIQRVSADLYYLWQPLGRGKYLCNEMRRLTPAEMIGDSANSETFVPPIALWSTFSRLFSKSVTFADPSIVYAGTGWSGASSRFSSVVGDTATWTTPANTVAVSMTYTEATNRGFARVLIDGDPTAANQLDTAAEAVAAGTLPADALVANGGTLQPTDRVLDFYSKRFANRPEPLIADDLPAAVHTVTLEVTGYKRAAASEARVPITSFMYVASTFDPTTAGTTVLNGVRLRDGSAVQESAYNLKINNVSEWCGGSHANLTGTSETITVDGTPVTMTDGQVLTSTSAIVINTAGTFHHIESATPTGNVTRTYTIDEDGMRIQHSTEWLVPFTPGTAAYPAMLTLGKAASGDYRWADFTRAGGSALATDIPLDGGGGLDGIEYPLGTSATMWTWTAGGHYLAIATMADAETSLQGWAHSLPRGNIVWDRPASSKLYWTLHHEDAAVPMPTVAPSTVWAADTRYRWAYVTDADAVASRA